MSSNDPNQLHRLFTERANAGDLNGMLELYEDDATLLTPDGRQARGRAAIAERLRELLALAPKFTSSSEAAVLSGDIALLSNRWTLTLGSGKKGTQTVQGRATEIVRRQRDGSWRYVLDMPALDTGSTDTPPNRSGAGELAAGHAGVFEQLIYAEEGPLARITLNRPERRNALSIELSGELTEAIELVRRSTTVKVLVVQGAGGTFCAGDDITEMPLWGDANEIVRRVHGYQRMADALEALDKITISCVEGFAVGGGLEITMATDFVIAAHGARWGMPEVDVGITPGWGGTTRMTRLIGRRMTKEINLLGALHPASRAVELGLWNRAVPSSRLSEELDALIEVLLSKNQQAMRQLKLIIDLGAEADLHTAQGFEALSAGLTGAVNGMWQIEDADRASGITSFIAGGEKWDLRRDLARDFWTDGEVPLGYSTDAQR